MLVDILTKTVNCSPASTEILLELTFKINGFNLSAIDWFFNKPACKSKEYYYKFVNIILPSLVTALLIIILIIFYLVNISSNIFLQKIRGIYTL